MDYISLNRFVHKVFISRSILMMSQVVHPKLIINLRYRAKLELPSVDTIKAQEMILMITSLEK